MTRSKSRASKQNTSMFIVLLLAIICMSISSVQCALQSYNEKYSQKTGLRSISIIDLVSDDKDKDVFQNHNKPTATDYNGKKHPQHWQNDEDLRSKFNIFWKRVI